MPRTQAASRAERLVTAVTRGINDVFRRYDFGNPYAESVVYDHRFTARDEASVQSDIERLTRHFIEFEDAPRFERQKIADRHLGTGKFHGDLHRDIVKEIEA